MTVHILLADDHKLVREGIKFFLERIAEEVVVVEAGTFEEAHRLASECDRLDLIILDLKMPGMNGLAGLAAMRKRFPDVPTVILSGSLSRRDAIEAIEGGAAGYLPKSLSGKALLHAVQLVLSGETYLPTFVLSDGAVGEDASDERGPALTNDNPLKKLTKRECDVLACLVQGCPNKEIARRLDVEEITVKVHLQSVFRKLGVSNRTQAATAAIQLGWEA